MFQDGIKKAFDYVVPIAVARRLTDGTAQGRVIGAAVLLNSEGWFVTAGHVLQELGALAEETKGKSRPNTTRKRATHFVPFFGAAGPIFEGNLMVQPEADIGFGRVKAQSSSRGYPELRSSPIDQGEILCRVGYPFTNEIETTWEKGKGFNLVAPFPVPVFANEGMVSRFLDLPNGARWIEMSSPGLPGQSGGPVIDAQGALCGIQINTGHYPLAGSNAGPDLRYSVGRAVHIDTIREAAREKGIPLSLRGERHDH